VSALSCGAWEYEKEKTRSARRTLAVKRRCGFIRVPSYL
jgi:hypothetical protein